MNPFIFRLAEYSLAFLWIFTGVTSLWFESETGYEILATAEIEGIFAEFLLIGGAILDMAIGLWLLSRRYLKLCYLSQLCVMTVYTFLLSMIDPSYWLHPFGPITKNMPIAILILMLYLQEHELSNP